MMNSKCKTCGRAKEGCGAWLAKKKPNTLCGMCEKSFYIGALDMDKFKDLVYAGMDIRYKVGRLGVADWG